MTDTAKIAELLHEAAEKHHLVHALVQLDRDHTAEAPENPREGWYAQRPADRLGAP